MNKQTVLVTGGAGFIGSNFVNYFLKKYEKYRIVNVDKLTYAGNLSNVEITSDEKSYFFEQIDIVDRDQVFKLFEKYNVQHVIHFAAESHVDNSISNPGAFAQTNIIGTMNLLEAARNQWMERPFKTKTDFQNSRFHHISTDEVYGTLDNEGFFTEETPYAPNSPYSASKASSDLLVRSYYHTYGMNVVTTNCSNNYGPKQHDEKLIPTLVRKALKNEKLPIYGNGENVRDWLYVMDHCKAIDLVFHKGMNGETYLVGGRNEKTNIQIANIICEYLDEKVPKEGSYKHLIKFVQDRPGHDFRYAIDASKLIEELGWQANETFETGILKTVDWYINKYAKEDSIYESKTR